jgi:hypothetical protein
MENRGKEELFLREEDFLFVHAFQNTEKQKN